jgi:hypothetical protein
MGPKEHAVPAVPREDRRQLFQDADLGSFAGNGSNDNLFETLEGAGHSRRLNSQIADPTSSPGGTPVRPK